jgi:hypothetical protein
MMLLFLIYFFLLHFFILVYTPTFKMAEAAHIGTSVAVGLFPVMNPLFLPIHMAIFTILIIILLVYGFTLRSSVLIAWLIPAAIGAMIAYGAIGLGSRVVSKQGSMQHMKYEPPREPESPPADAEGGKYHRPLEHGK